MSYVINKTDGSVLINILDGTTNTETGLTLIGRNYTGYGEVQNENFIRLLENFASPLPPGESVGFAPIAGTLWWDTANQRLKIYNGVGFVSVSPLVGSNTAPVSATVGDQWWNIANCQLSSWTGSSWQLIGPIYTATQGKHGPVVETVLDNTNNSRTIVTEYANNEVVYVSSNESFILLNTLYGFTAIQRGINLPGNKVVEGNAFVGGYSTLGDDVVVNGQLILARLNGTTPVTGAAVVPGTDNIYDIGTKTQQFRNIYTGGSVVLTDANIYFENKSLVVQNKNLNGNVEIYVNTTASGNILAARVDGTTGLMHVSANPENALGVATKDYTDTAIESFNSTLSLAIASTDSNVTALTQTLETDFATLLSALQSNVNLINANDAITSASLSSLTDQVAADEISNTDSFASINSSIGTINTTLTTLAPLANPSLIGVPTAPTPAVGDNSLKIATTAFVTAADAVLVNDYTSKIAAQASNQTASLTNGLALKANIASPAFTGTPTAPTPAPGDNSTRLATTAFVTGVTATQKFNYTVSTNPPSGGNNGDFWFQIG